MSSEPGANISDKTHLTMITLHAAARVARKTDTLMFLINAGADVNAKTENGTTPSHFATTYKRCNIYNSECKKLVHELVHV